MSAKKSQALLCVDFLGTVELPALVWGLFDGLFFQLLLFLLREIILVLFEY